MKTLITEDITKREDGEIYILKGIYILDKKNNRGRGVRKKLGKGKAIYTLS